MKIPRQRFCGPLHKSHSYHRFEFLRVDAELQTNVDNWIKCRAQSADTLKTIVGFVQHTAPETQPVDGGLDCICGNQPPAVIESLPSTSLDSRRHKTENSDQQMFCLR